MTWPNELLSVNFASVFTLTGMPENDGSGRSCREEYRKSWRNNSATGLTSSGTWTTSDGTPLPTSSQRLLSNFSAMRSDQARSQQKDSGQVPRAITVELGRPGEAPRWTSTLAHPRLLQREETLQKGGLLRLHRRPTWQLSDHEKRSLRDKVLQKGGQRCLSYWDLAGEMLEGTRQRLDSYYADRRQDFPGCGGKIPGEFDDEYEEDHGVCIVGSKRKTEEDARTLGGAPLLKRRHISTSADSGMDQLEYTSTARVQTAADGDTGSQESQQDFFGYHALPDVEYPVHAHDGGFLQRLGGEHLRSGGVRRVACGAAQLAVHEPVSGWPTDEYQDERGTELQDGEPPGPHPHQLLAAREFSEEGGSGDGDIPFESNLDQSETPVMSDDDDHPGIINDPDSDTEFDQYESDYFNYYNYHDDSDYPLSDLYSDSQYPKPQGS